MIAVVGVIVLITILVWVFVAEALFMGNYQQLERNDVQDALDATHYSLELSAGEMNQTARDYASWNDTYSFVVNNNTNYVSDNLVDSTFQNLRLNLIFIENTDGKIVVAKAYDLVNGSFVALPGELDRLASTDSPLFFHNESAGTSTGILYTANGPLLVASQPILTSTRTGPIHGTLVFGRYLTPDVINAIAGPERAVSAYPFGAQSPDDVQRVEPVLAGGAASVIEPVNATNVAGFTLLRDIYGKPSLVIEEVLPRTLYQAGLSSTNAFLGLLVVSGIILLTGMVWSLRQSVLSPLLRVNTSLARIRTSDDLSKRVPERGDVELVWLAHAINATLASLESSHAERDAAGDELRESERRIREITDALPVVVYETDATGRFTFVNATSFDLFGYTKEELEAGMSVFQLIVPADKEQARAVFLRRMNGEDIGRMEYTGLRKNGSTFHISIRAVMIRQDAAVVGLRGVIVDVTERKKADSVLHEAQEALRQHATMFDAAHDAIMTLDPEGTITYWNRGAERLYGWTTQEAEGQDANALLRTRFPESQEVLWPKLLKSGLWEGELINITRDGVPVTVASSWTLLKDEKGNASAILEISSDVTERKKAELALAESEAKLRITFATMADGIVIVGLDEKVTDCNEAILRLTQRSREEIIGKPFADLLAPEFRSLIPGARKLLVGAILVRPARSRSEREPSALTYNCSGKVEKALT